MRLEKRGGERVKEHRMLLKKKGGTNETSHPTIYDLSYPSTSLRNQSTDGSTNVGTCAALPSSSLCRIFPHEERIQTFAI